MVVNKKVFTFSDLRNHYRKNSGGIATARKACPVFAYEKRIIYSTRLVDLLSISTKVTVLYKNLQEPVKMCRM